MKHTTKNKPSLEDVHCHTRRWVWISILAWVSACSVSGSNVDADVSDPDLVLAADEIGAPPTVATSTLSPALGALQLLAPPCHSYNEVCPGTTVSFTSGALNCGAPYCSGMVCGPIEANRTAMAQDREYYQIIESSDGTQCVQWRSTFRKLTGCSCLDD